MSTINRTAKSLAIAIVGAEYVTRMVPIGTHDWNKFVTPNELSMMIESQSVGLILRRKQGLVMSVDPFTQGQLKWHLDDADLDVNYIVHAVKSTAGSGSAATS